MGLEGSIWAPKVHDSAHTGLLPGDWICGKCNFSNYKWRAICLQCSSKPLTIESTSWMESIKPETVPISSHQKYSDEGRSDSRSIAASTLQHVPFAVAQSSWSAAESGLVSSIWAPRNACRRTHGNDNGQVWTRTVPALQQDPSRTHNLPPSKATELGLPYQVQHYILTMIERMLEESCYEFASRWIPDILHGKGWDCAEAVELATWRTFLPMALPHNAIKPLSNYTLEAALVDAVRTRNSAVHRHLCDNVEIRKMALQAQDLMSMFSDTTRQSKFHRLWSELREWDTASILDSQGARTKLESVLQEISERPLDDMDWTPNAVSLLEVTPDSGESHAQSEYSMDAMDLD